MADTSMTEEEFKNTPIVEKEDGLYHKNLCLIYRAEEEIQTVAVRRICETLKPKSVIELGFGLGFSANAIQEYGVEKHIIIEAHPYMYNLALAWAEGKEGVQVINDFYQNVVITEHVDLVYEDLFDLVYHNFVNPFNSTHCQRFMGEMYTPEEKAQLELIWNKNMLNL
jgi:hypothetical protein